MISILNLKSLISRSSLWALLKLLSDECHRFPLMVASGNGLVLSVSNHNIQNIICTSIIMRGFWLNTLRPRQMAAIFQMTFSNAFSWMKMFEFRLKFHGSLFLRFQLTIFQHWFRYWLGAIQATSHYLNQWWLAYRRIYASLGLSELKPYTTCQVECLMREKDHTETIRFGYHPHWWSFAHNTQIILNIFHDIIPSRNGAANKQDITII